MRRFTSYWQAWLFKRFALHTEKQLAQRDILVFFNREGYLYLVLIIITFIAGVNYGNNLVLALCFLFTSLMVLSFYLAFRQLYGLTLKCEVNDLGQVAQPLIIKLYCQPRKHQFHLHLRCQYKGFTQKITALESPLILQFEDIPLRRGKFLLDRFYFYSVYPFGIVRAWTYVYPQQQIWIAPEPLAFDHLTTRQDVQQQHQQPSGHDDFSHLRSFQIGDALHRIAWQQLAKGRGLLVKSFEEYQHNNCNFHYNEMTMSLHEQKISQLMFLIEQAHQQNSAFSLSLPSQQLGLGKGQAHYDRALLLLAQEP